MKQLTFFLAWIVLSCGFLIQAQEAEIVTLRILSFPKSRDPQPVELRMGESEVIKVNTPTNALSQPYQVKRLSTWSFGKMEPPKSGEEKANFISYGSAPSIASNKQLILLIRSGQENKDGLRVVVVDDQVGNFGGGKFFFMNAAKVDIAGMLGGKKFALKPGAHMLIEPAETRKRQDSSAEQFFTEFFFRKENEARPFFSSTWPHNVKARSMVFFYHDPHNDRLRMHTIRDYLP